MARKPIDKKKIIRSNPKVNRDECSEVSRVIQELRRVGVRRQEYSIAHPFTGSHVPITDDD